MDFWEKPTLEEKRRQEDIKKYVSARSCGKLIVSTIAILILALGHIFSSINDHKKESSYQTGIEKAESLSTLEGRETFLAQKYPHADISAEKNINGAIISVFEVDTQHSFCVFEPYATGYQSIYRGQLFAKTAMVKGSAFLGEDRYDIYLLGEEPFTHLDITRTDAETGETLQQEQISFDASGIALLKLNPIKYDARERIVAYDEEGNASVLVDGTL